MVRVHAHPQMKGYVYIIQSTKNQRYYIGSSVNPERRLSEFHNLNKVQSTKYLTPWILKFTQEYGSITSARKIERKLKQMKSKIIIEKIICNKKCTISIS